MTRAEEYARRRGLLQLRRQFIQQRGDSAHFFHLPDLVFEIVEIEPPAGLHLLCKRFRRVMVDRALHVFDQRQHVTHAEYA